MSVVATRIYDDKIVMASDSIRVRYGTTQEKLKFAKLYQVKDVTVGAVGMAEETGLFRIYLATHQPIASTEVALLDLMVEFQEWAKKKTDQSGKYELSNEYHLAFGGKVFRVTGYHIQEITDYDATGAGMDFALAAMYLGMSPIMAVEAACAHSIYCEPPVNVIEIPKAKREYEGHFRPVREDEPVDRGRAQPQHHRA